MASSKLNIRTMRQDEVAIAVDWAKQEGWNPGINDAELFYQADPNGFFVGEVDGEIVAVGIAVVYDDNFAFCGLYIVAPQHRGKGYGLELTKHRLNYCANRNIGIDGVLENVAIYQRIGYIPFYQNKRYQFTASASGKHSATVRSITADDLPALLSYDRQCFPAPRDNFLKAWITQENGKSVLFKANGKVQGFAVRRQCHQGYKIGPLFADNIDIAKQLLSALQTDISGESVLLDVPENNDDAVQLAESLDMTVVFATARMYQKGLPDINNEKIFGITTFELG
ncbi:GNAT family N-acetyltransferase [Litorilituus sediminis]|uniref:N-acetyltransferase n=1 Tax=Litorilituus sediminis TaxID=718192 RepID=A0A4P6PC75_9GAMM|nr:GNAT family N-acetyltransferase [Litorilituus sediminis]QBG37267.1 N-acetyltransferase [Litorilituus sediminis]